MISDIWTLAGTAFFLGSVHTLMGPDHYIPFIVMSKARKWSLIKTIWITVLCGLGHVASSIILGFVGISLGLAVASLEWFEGSRGNFAAWLLTVFGLLYFIWGVRNAIRNKPHVHHHHHKEGAHAHKHVHSDEHTHVHDAPTNKNMTPWIMFTIFVFGPCEPLIPILMYPAATMGTMSVVLVATIFALATLLTMVSAVVVATFGLNRFATGRLERYSHAMAGATVCLCGILIHLGF